MERRFKKARRGASLLGLLASGLIFWAPLQAASHRLTVPHTWCEIHGHLIELAPENLGPRREFGPRSGDALGALADERAEISCSSLAHERRPAALPTELPISGAPPATVVLGWAAPELPDRCLDCAPKQGPPTGL